MVVGGAAAALLPLAALGGVVKAGLAGLVALALIPVASLLLFLLLVALGQVEFTEPDSFHHDDRDRPRG